MLTLASSAATQQWQLTAAEQPAYGTLPGGYPTGPTEQPAYGTLSGYTAGRPYSGFYGAGTGSYAAPPFAIPGLNQQPAMPWLNQQPATPDLNQQQQPAMPFQPAMPWLSQQQAQPSTPDLNQQQPPAMPWLNQQQQLPAMPSLNQQQQLPGAVPLSGGGPAGVRAAADDQAIKLVLALESEAEQAKADAAAARNETAALESQVKRGAQELKAAQAEAQANRNAVIDEAAYRSHCSLIVAPCVELCVH